MSRSKRADLTRREFLNKMGQTAAVAGVGAMGFGIGESIAHAAKTRVVVVSGTDPYRMLKSALRVFRELEAAVKGKQVVIKPNMSFKNPPTWGNNTNPEVAAAVARMCKEWGAAHIAAVDHALVGGPRALKVCGVQPALEKIGGVEVISADKKSEYVTKSVPKGKALKRTAIHKSVAKADVLINVPVAKQHSATRFGAGMKNLMGLIWDRRYFHQMISLHQGIADLSLLIQPRLTVIDATRVMVTNGPQGPGEVQKLHKLVVGTDPVATDAVAVGLTRWKRQQLKPQDVEHLRLAAELGIGVADLSSIKVVKKRV